MTLVVGHSRQHLSRTLLPHEKRAVGGVHQRGEGEYGIHGLFVGVPVVLGKDGIERIVELKLTDDESAALRKSADAVAELVSKLTC